MIKKKTHKKKTSKVLNTSGTTKVTHDDLNNLIEQIEEVNIGLARSIQIVSMDLKNLREEILEIHELLSTEEFAHLLDRKDKRYN